MAPATSILRFSIPLEQGRRGRVAPNGSTHRVCAHIKKNPRRVQGLAVASVNLQVVYTLHISSYLSLYITIRRPLLSFLPLTLGFGHYHAYIRDVLQTEHTDDNMEANTQTISHPLEEATKVLITASSVG